VSRLADDARDRYEHVVERIHTNHARVFSHAPPDKPSLVEVDHDICTKVSSIIAKRKIPLDREEISLAGIPSSLVGNFFLFLVAICHQTSPIGARRLEGRVNGKVLFGWDYLLAKFEQRAQADISLLEPRRWTEVTGDLVSEIFADDELGNLLTKNDERAGLIRNLGVGLQQRDWYSADDIYDYCEGRVGSGHPNLLETLHEFQAYRDPVFKKTLFFLALMRNSGSWQFPDYHLMGAPVDYHEVRGHLRIGTVRVQNASLLQKIRDGDLVTSEEDIAIRRAVYEAILTISDLSGLGDPSRLHYYFWNIFRAVCLRENPLCVATSQPALLPPRYQVPAAADGDILCPFEAVCTSAHQRNPIIEHACITDFY
jgi:hypothetical protein